MNAEVDKNEEGCEFHIIQENGMEDLKTMEQ